VSTNGYIVTSWVATSAVLVGYAAAILRRGRKLSRQVRPERRRWM
jgi:heme exporter protein CcmD